MGDTKKGSYSPNTITYWETREINIGDYEKISSGLSFTSKIHSKNLMESTVKISHVEKCPVDVDEVSFNEASIKMMKRVKRVLDAREKQIREATNDFTDFNSLAKSPSKNRTKRKINRKIRRIQDDDE